MNALIKALKGMYLAANFTAYEFCNSLDQYAIKVPNIQLFVKLQILRMLVGSITITSGFRTWAYNIICGGSSNSFHLKGLAADIRFDFTGWNKKQLTDLLQYIGFTNVNFYWDGKRLDRLHVDIGKTWNGQEFNYRDKVA